MATAEEIKTRAAAYLEPISEDEPAGKNAAYDPAYTAVKNEMVALDSPSGGEVQWDDVAKRGGELLKSTTKDLLLASYTGFALAQTEQLAGLAVALEVLRGLFERFWEPMYPPKKRLRARGNALDWLLTRLVVLIPSFDVDASHRPLFDLVDASFRALGDEARDKLGPDHMPSTRAVAEVLTRLGLRIPAGQNPAPATAAEPSPPANNPTPVPTESTAPNTPSGTGSGDAAKPKAEESGPQQTAPPASETEAPEQAHAKDPVDEAMEAAGPWLEAISGDNPTGADARFEPEYESAKTQVGKLELPGADAPDWDEVIRLADTVLKTKAKDILIAGYFVYARLIEKGLESLPVGLAIVTGIMQRYGETMHPKRARARGNAVAWLFDRLEQHLGNLKLEPTDRPTVLALEAVFKNLVPIARETLGDHAPGTSPLAQRIQRMLLAVPEKKPDPPKESPPPAQPSAPAQSSPEAPQAQPAPAAAPADSVKPAPATKSITDAAEVGQFLRASGSSLVDTARLLQKADCTDPLAYRLIRQGLWIQVSAPLRADESGKTVFPPPNAMMRQQLDTLEGVANWTQLAKSAEALLMNSRFLLDLNRITFMALEKMDDDTQAAQAAIAGEVAALLCRSPNLPDLTMSDGTPLADKDTKAWLSEHVLIGKGGGDADADPATAEFDEIKTMMKGKGAAEGMKKAQALIAASSGRTQFLRRLLLAEICLDTGRALLARGMFAALDSELDSLGVAHWEPDVAARCLEGFVKAIQAAAGPGKGGLGPREKYEHEDRAFERLCLFDPAAAARLTPK